MKRTGQQRLAELKRVWLTYFVDESVYRIEEGTYYCEKRNKEIPGILVYDKTRGFVDMAHIRKEMFVRSLITKKDIDEFKDKVQARNEYLKTHLLDNQNDIIVEYKGRKGKIHELKGEFIFIDCTRHHAGGVDKIEFLAAHVEACKFKSIERNEEIVITLENF